MPIVRRLRFQGGDDESASPISVFAVRHGSLVTQYPDDDDEDQFSHEKALRIATVYRCVNIIAGGVSGLPLQMLRRQSNSAIRERVFAHPLLDLLEEPNDWQTGSQFRKQMTAHLLLHGNAYAQIVRKPSTGAVEALWPLEPTAVSVGLTKQKKIEYKVTVNGKLETFGRDGMLHLRGFSRDGLTGMSVLEQARRSCVGARNVETFGSKLFKYRAQPGGVLALPEGKTLPLPRQQALQKELDDMAGAEGFAHKVLIVQDGMKFQPVSMTPNDAQFIETRKFLRSEIAMIFGVPETKLASGDRPYTSGQSVEAQGRQFVQDTLHDYLTEWEHSLRVLTNDRAMEFRHDVDEFVRADQKSRNESHAIGRQWGWLSSDEVRIAEGRGPRPDGKGADDYIDPQNMGGGSNNTERPERDGNEQPEVPNE